MKQKGLVKVVSLLFLCSILSYSQSIESLMSEGNTLLSNGAYSHAATKFRKILGFNPGSFEARFNLGLCYLNQGMNDKAISEFKQAIAIKRDCSECWSNIAVAYENLGRTSDALNALYNAVNYNPSDVNARINLASMYVSNNQLEKAIYQYKQVIEIDGNNLSAYLNAGKCYLSLGNADKAKYFLEAALGVDPQDAEIYWELGNLYWKKKENTKKAEEQYKKAIELKPEVPEYYQNLALMYEELGKKQDAVKTWKACLVYLDDAFEKDKIKDRIDMLEGKAGSGAASDVKGSFKKRDAGAETEKLKKELRGEERKEQKIIRVDTMNVLKDMEDLNIETNSEFDLEKATESIRKKKDK